MKTCARCGESKTVDEFYHGSQCRVCIREVRERDSRYRERDRRDYYRRRKYGLTPDQYQAMLATQEGVCALPSCNKTDLHVDHSHVTGLVRGLLCSQHNRALGVFGDEVEGIREVLDYLLVHDRVQS